MMQNTEVKKMIGKRVKCLQIEDEHAPAKNTYGTITNIDSNNTIHVLWDDGKRLGIVPAIDLFEIETMEH